MTCLRQAPGIAWITAEGAAYVAHIPSGPIIVLTGPAAVIWDELTIDGDAATLTERVSERMSDVPPDADATVKQVVERLQAEGLLVRPGGDASH
jgi:hypothetical protein